MNEEVNLVFGIIQCGHSSEKLLQKWGRLFDENSDHQMRDLLQTVEQNVVLPAIGALKRRSIESS